MLADVAHRVESQAGCLHFAVMATEAVLIDNGGLGLRSSGPTHNCETTNKPYCST
jgi:hypothetical protein